MKISFITVVGSEEEGWDVVKTTVKSTEYSIKETSYPKDIYDKDFKIAEMAAEEFATKKGLLYINDETSVYTVMKIRGSYHSYKINADEESSFTVTKKQKLYEAIEEVRKKALANDAVFIDPTIRPCKRKRSY